MTITGVGLGNGFNCEIETSDGGEIDAVSNFFKKNYDSIINDYFSFLEFQTISCQPSHSKDMIDCAQWLKSFLEEMSFKTEIWETSGHSAVFAQNLSAGVDKPTILIYNHYDVQPVEPLDEWNTPPFSPTMVGNKVYCRGAQDDKGQCMYVLYGLKALMEKDGGLPINVKIILDGEEECGSAGLLGILDEKKEDLKCDTLAIVDVGIQQKDVPSITLGVRGIVGFDVEVEVPNRDLHSGAFGGMVKNPIQVMADTFATLHDKSGKVAIPGFYDTVKPLTKEEHDLIDFSFDEKEFEETYGCPAHGGEKAYSPMERKMIRPTLEFNGIQAGGVGEKGKTIIPSVSKARITCRLVPDQEPKKIGNLVSEYLMQQAPKDVKYTVNVRKGIAWPTRTDPRCRSVQVFAQAYSEVFEKPCQYTFAGGSIALARYLTDACGGELVLMGLGLPEDNMHAPNESFDMERFEEGMQIIARTLSLLGRRS